MDRAALRQGMLAVQASPPSTGAPGTERPDALFDPNHSFDIRETC
jgi:hypothetical protein